jgi:hypothetical protein
VRLQRYRSVDRALPGWQQKALHSRPRAKLRVVRTVGGLSFRQPSDCENGAAHLLSSRSQKT